MRLKLLPLLALATAGTGCERAEPISAVRAEPWLSLTKQFGAEMAGRGTAILYIAPESGLPLFGCANSFCSAFNAIRVTVIRGKAREWALHTVPLRTHGAFSYYRATDRAVSPFGVIRYSPAGSPPAWIERQYGDGPPIDSMQAELSLPSGYVIRYQYKAESEQDQAASYSAVLRLVRSANLLGARPNNSSKPTPLRGAA